MNDRIFLPLLLFLGVAVVKKKQGVEKEGEIAVHNQRHAKSDPIGRAYTALLLLIVFLKRESSASRSDGVPVFWLTSGTRSAFVLLLRKKGAS